LKIGNGINFLGTPDPEGELLVRKP
jgi:hypothetical protein